MISPRSSTRSSRDGWSVEERLALDITVSRDGEVLHRLWAVNEASLEKADRQRMIEVVVEIDGRPLSRWGCDGVVCATPTGSTAYAFSAGGPVVWPEVEALLCVPISAHALFARPLVTAPNSVIAAELVGRVDGVLWSDGRRSVPVQVGDRVDVRRSVDPLRVARLEQTPFTDRLVAKFALPIDGWRGASGGAAVIEELRITGLGVIEDAVLELGPGLTVVTGETGAGKTMVVTALGLLLGGRADAGAVRAGVDAGQRRGTRRRGRTRWPAAPRRRGRTSTTTS